MQLPARAHGFGRLLRYLCLPDGNLVLAIGDVAGKGISAALLMASIQSIVRTQLAAGMPSTARLIAQLNRQLYANTAPEKYATFFLGAYDVRSRILTYTNAGHLQPPLLRVDNGLMGQLLFQFRAGLGHCLAGLFPTVLDVAQTERYGQNLFQ
jgi:hypothetical protein